MEVSSYLVGQIDAEVDTDDLVTSNSDGPRYPAHHWHTTAGQDEHPSLLAALESHNVAVEISVAKVTAAPVAHAWLQVKLLDCRTVSLYSAGGNFALLLRAKGDIEIEM